MCYICITIKYIFGFSRLLITNLIFAKRKRPDSPAVRTAVVVQHGADFPLPE